MKKLIIIAGGGTGGHIYPGLAIARALQKLDPQARIEFVGSHEGLESQIVPREGFQLHLIQSGKLNISGGFLTKLKTLVRLPLGIFQAISLILDKKPTLVLGVGGYASGPFVLAAALLGFETAIWEPNALPGLANRWLSRFVKKCYVVFPEAKKFFKNKNILVIGMPIREEIENLSTQTATTTRQDQKFHILHYGGSQGSRAIGRALCEMIQKYKSELNDFKFVHQTGKTDYQDFLQKYKGYEDLVEVKEFIHEMPKYYQWADLVVCRGGASTISEIQAFGLPAIVIPLPAADAHQEKNAEALIAARAGEMILQKDLTPDSLYHKILELKKNPQNLKTMSEKARTLHKPLAAKNIAQDLLHEV